MPSTVAQGRAKGISLLTILVCLTTVAGLQPATGASGAQTPASAPPTAQEESQALDRAFAVPPGNPLALIKSLEDFLARYPQSTRREQVLRTIYKQALQANDPRKAAAAGEKLLELTPEDPDLLSALTDLYDRQGDPSSREKALLYGTRFVEHAEKLAAESRPAEIPAVKWEETHSLIRATAYFMRGKVYAKSGDNDRAVADFEKSLSAYPTVEVAERLGDVAMKRGETDRAIDAYATAFALPDSRLDPARREEVRKKLGSAYVSKYQSQNGLGDLILARYDELATSLVSRWKGAGRPNARINDPDEFVLQRLDGSELRLRELRGRVVVMDFWATWCFPCRLQGKLLELVVENFRQEPAVTFLSVNTDADRSGVPDFLKEEKWTVPVVYSQGLDQLLGIRALPMLIILDREGRVFYRQGGVDPGSFVPMLDKKVREALNTD